MERLLKILTGLVFLSAIFLTAESCKKKTTPLVTTANVTEITSTTAKSGGNVTDDGNANVTERGVCWSTTQNPTTSSNKTSDGSGVGTFTSNLTGLTSNTTYYVRAYATNSEGTAYGNELSFTTQCQLPSATTNAASDVTGSSATLNGTVNASGSSTTVTFEYGLTTSYGSSVTATQSPLTGSSNTAVSAAITGLTPGTTYHFRAKAVNCGGTATGTDQTFTTSCPSATATTNAASGVGNTTATLNGTVNAKGTTATVTFEYGLTTSYGSTVTATPSPVTGSSNTDVSASVTGLTPGTTYHFRVKAVNCGGTVNGSDQTFTTSCPSATATTNPATGVTYTTATLNGTVNANGSSTTVTFEYGLTTAYGSTVTATQSPLTGSSNTAVSASITGLIPGATYHFRVKAVNCGGTVTGTDRQFTTPEAKSSLHHTGIVQTNVDLNTRKTLGQITINPSVSGKVIVSFDGVCFSSPGDRIVLAASNTTDWDTNDGNVNVEAFDSDLNTNAFSHTRVYDVTPGSHTFYAVGQNYVETDGDGLASIYGSLTVQFIPSTSGSIVGFSGIIRPNVNVTSTTTVGSVTINPSVPGKAIVKFDGLCISSPGDRIILAASNTSSWYANDGSVSVEAANSDIDRKSFCHTRVYDVSPGSNTFNAVVQNNIETDGDGIASIYGSLTVHFIPSYSGSFIGFSGIEQTDLDLNTLKTLQVVTISPTVSGKVLVRFDGKCLSSPGDAIILAASNTTSWGINDGNVYLEAIDSDIDRNSFSHTRVYSIGAGSTTLRAVGQNWVETDGDGIASVYGSLTVVFFPD